MAGAILLGAILGGAAIAIERIVLRASTGAHGAIPLFVAVAFVAPLHQGASAAAAWPALGVGKPRSPRDAVVLGGLAAAGAALVHGAVMLVVERPYSIGGIVRISLVTPSWLFLAMAWSLALGRAGSRRRGFFTAWLGATLAHGVLLHLLSLRASVGLAFALPLFFAMAALGWAARGELLGEASHAARGSRRAPVSLREVRHALGRHERPVSFAFVVLGALVNQGLLLVLLAVAVVIGRRLGLDFASLDDPETATAAPLALLGAAAVLAFPASGFVLARASEAPTLIEPALSATLAIAGLTVILGVAAPIALAFALACVPIALALSCAGAWVGAAR